MNRYANLDAIAARYASAADPLNASQFWYHAEFFDKDRLASVFADEVVKGGKNFAPLVETPEAVGVLKNPALICYYLFFPGHDEGLPGCEAVASAQMFASFAGEWACLAVLLDGPGPASLAPIHVGLSLRNVGVADHLGDEVRVGMRIFSWNALEKLDEHPRLVVAKGSHALYLETEAPAVVKAFTPDDPGRNSCGLAEPVAAAMDGTKDVTAPPFLLPVNAPVTVVVKVLSGMAGGALVGLLGGLVGAFFGAAIGFTAGLMWAMAEAKTGAAPSPSPPPPPPIPGPVVDTVPTTAAGPSAGKVVHPVGKLPSDAAPDRSQAWRSDKVTLAGRQYDFTVDRDAQILWAGDPILPGFPGRWGPPVEADPAPRRAGMRFPKFWRMFFSELVITLPPPPPPPAQVLISGGVEIGNATLGGGLSAAYDGNKTQTFAASPTSTSAPGVFNGKRFATKYRISGIKFWLSSDRGLNIGDGAVRTCKVYGRNNTDPISPTDGTEVFSFLVTDTANGFADFLAGFDTTNTYDRIWVTVPNPLGNTTLAVFTEIEWYGSP